ncbi:hypothetical protein WR25_25859 [Diploscapter pachys]|uniref:Uncharacterized protein n=1 Tax=Diploscapter pachys TaxID=2018661 RepID=A0A2A2KC35_9BILA|nr:hypothetical protein WR25_25859 [Diploscapter pachys]
MAVPTPGRLPAVLATEEDRAAVVQRAVAGAQDAILDVGRRQNDGARHQSDAEFPGQVAEQLLACQILIVAWIQQWLDPEQVAVLAWHALVEGQVDAQVRQVMALRALQGPEAVATEGGEGDQRQGAD